MSGRGLYVACGLALACGPSAGSTGAGTEDDTTSSGTSSGSSSGAESGTGEVFEVCTPDIVEGDDPIDEGDCDSFFPPLIPKIPPPLQIRIVNARDEPITVREQYWLDWVEVRGTAGGREIGPHIGCAGEEPYWRCEDENETSSFPCPPIAVVPATQPLPPNQVVVQQWDRVVSSNVVLPADCRTAVDAPAFPCQALMFAPIGTYEVSADAFAGTCTKPDEGCETLTAATTWDGLCETLELVFE